MRVFVGCAPNGEDAESMAVLEWTIRSRTSEPVQITWMRQGDGFWDGWATENWATPFSGFRWGVPAFCNFEGRAIYMDSDMIVLDDLVKLIETPIPRGKVAATKGSWRTCVMVWDCAAAASVLPPIERIKSDPEAHSKLIRQFQRDTSKIEAFDPAWNYCDNEDFGPLGTARIIHYTAMDTQPHLQYALPRLAAQGRGHWFNGTIRRHPRQEIQTLFDEALIAAVVNGYDPENYIPPGDLVNYRKASLVNYRGHA